MQWKTVRHGPRSHAAAIKTEIFREILRAKEALQDDRATTFPLISALFLPQFCPGTLLRLPQIAAETASFRRGIFYLGTSFFIAIGKFAVLGKSH